VSQQKVSKITVFLLLFLRSCAACLKIYLEENFMPIYEYRCADCDHQLEVVQKLSEQPIVSCPECKKDSLKRIISAAGFRLKGDGWYETDFKSGNKKNVAGSESSSSGGGSSSDS
jgi:putative FmdB family regulatory protein